MQAIFLRESFLQSWKVKESVEQRSLLATKVTGLPAVRRVCSQECLSLRSLLPRLDAFGFKEPAGLQSRLVLATGR